MSKKLEVLRAYLETLGVDVDISSLEKRKQIQKAVYLAQRLGVDLGYRYNWYAHGPYCPRLTTDYYAFNEATLPAAMTGAVVERLHQAQARLADNPTDLPPVSWWELLASVDFLMHVSHLDDAQAAAVLGREKPHLVEFFAIGKQRLEEWGLLE